MQYRPKTNAEAELGVLGALILDGNPKSITVQKAFLQLHEDLFYYPQHKELFDIISNRFASQQCFDVGLLLGMEIGQPVHDLISQYVLNQYHSTTMLMPYIHELQKLSDIRKQFYILESALRNSFSVALPEDMQEILSNAIQKAGNIPISRIRQGATFAEILIDYQHNKFSVNTKVECGIKQFGEIRNNSLITIAGSSGVGKTFFSLYFMREIIKYQCNKQFLFFSLEMPKQDIWERYLTLHNNISSANLLDVHRNIKLPDGLIFDEPRIDIDYIETIARIEALKKPLSVIVVDYIGLVSSKGKYDREDLRISNITQRLAGLAMNLNCIVIALTQVNRDPNKRTKEDRCPYPSDVADSVGSVRSSSLWIGIDRPELYDSAMEFKNRFVAKCRKSRYGNNFEAWFSFNEGRFKEIFTAPVSSFAKKSDLDYLDQEIGDI